MRLQRPVEVCCKWHSTHQQRPEERSCSRCIKDLSPTENGIDPHTRVLHNILLRPQKNTWNISRKASHGAKATSTASFDESITRLHAWMKAASCTTLLGGDVYGIVRNTGPMGQAGYRCPGDKPCSTVVMNQNMDFFISLSNTLSHAMDPLPSRRRCQVA